MATTNPDNIWTPDSGDDYALTTDLAATADTIQDALTRRANYFVGTTAELAGYAATAPEGSRAYDTTLDKEYRLESGVWVEVPAPVLIPVALPDHTSAPAIEGQVSTNTTTNLTYVYLDGAWRVVNVNLPYVEFLKSSGQSVGEGTRITYTGTGSSVGSWSQSGGIITVPNSGILNVSAKVGFSGGTGASYYRLIVARNGDVGANWEAMGAGPASIVSVGTAIKVTTGDTIRVIAGAVPGSGYSATGVQGGSALVLQYSTLF